MFVVENLDRCIYKIQISDFQQTLVEDLASLYGVEQETVVKMMFVFAENMAISKIFNKISQGD